MPRRFTPPARSSYTAVMTEPPPITVETFKIMPGVLPVICGVALFTAALLGPLPADGRVLTAEETWELTGGAKPDPERAGCCDFLDRCLITNPSLKCDERGVCAGDREQPGDADGKACRPYEFGEPYPTFPKPCENWYSDACRLVGFCSQQPIDPGIPDGPTSCQFTANPSQSEVSPLYCEGNSCGI